MRIVRGLELVTGSGEVSLSTGLDSSCSLWVAGSLGSSSTVIRSGDRCGASSATIQIAAVEGADRLVIDSTIAVGQYLAVNGTVWSFSVRDGSELDADGKINDQIVLPLSSMAPVSSETAQPPSAIAFGDSFLVLDPDTMRASTIEVVQ
jgi:hypothetical protein